MRISAVPSCPAVTARLSGSVFGSLSQIFNAFSKSSCASW